MQNDHSGQSGTGHGSLKGYLAGFILSVILTVVPFVLVMQGTLSPAIMPVCVVGFAVVQILVHLVYFLHMSTTSDGGWNFVAFVFTIIIIAIVVGGSLWIMYNLNANMKVW